MHVYLTVFYVYVFALVIYYTAIAIETIYIHDCIFI